MPPHALSAELVGHTLGHFTVEEFVGGGGMGAVFRGTDAKLGRTVAIKVLSRDQGDPETVRRFKNEAQSAARLDSPYIARVYFVGEEEGWHYIVFEYIEGRNLRDLVATRGPLSVEDAVGYAIDIAQALDHAYRRDVVHRDIKPSNVIITPDGRAKLVDMGLARLHKVETTEDLTASGVTLGTFDYISPEQARDPRSADVRSDLYSLGCTLFFILTGRPPFPEGTWVQKVMSHSGEAPPDPRSLRPDLPEELATIIARLLAKQPSARYRDPAELIGTLFLLAAQRGWDLHGRSGQLWISAPQNEANWVERVIPWLAPLGVLIALIVGLNAFYASSQSRPATLPPIRFTSAPQKAAGELKDDAAPGAVHSDATPGRIERGGGNEAAPPSAIETPPAESGVPASGDAATNDSKAPGAKTTEGEASAVPSNGSPTNAGTTGTGPTGTGPTNAGATSQPAANDTAANDRTNTTEANGANSGLPEQTPRPLPAGIAPAASRAPTTSGAELPRDSADEPSTLPISPSGSETPAPAGASNPATPGDLPTPRDTAPRDTASRQASPGAVAGTGAGLGGASASPGGTAAANANDRIDPLGAGNAPMGARGQDAAAAGTSGGSRSAPASTGVSGVGADSPGSQTASPAAPAVDTAPRTIVVGTAASGADAKPAVDSLASALRYAAENPSVHTIELCYDGWRSSPPLEISGRNLTFRAGEGFSPGVRLAPPETGLAADRRMIRISGGNVAFERLHLHVELPAAPLDGWALFALREGPAVALRDCTLTICNGGETAASRYFQLPAAFFELPRAEVTTAMMTGADVPAAPLTNIHLDRCVVRGQATLALLAEAQPLSLIWNEGLLATEFWLVEIAGGRSKPKWDISAHVELAHVTAFCRQGLCRVELSPSQPHCIDVDLKSSECIFIVDPQAPLVEHVGAEPGDALARRFHFRGADNFYPATEGDSLRWRVIPAAAGTPLEYTFDQRNEPWYEEKRAQKSVMWKQFPAVDLPVHLHAPSDYLLDSTVDHPALRSAAGFTPSMLRTPLEAPPRVSGDE